MENRQNLSMLCDYYEFTMADGYYRSDMGCKIAYFDIFFRSVPDSGGFAIAAGLEMAIEYLKNLSFTKEDVSYLRKTGNFCDGFLEYLENFKLTADIWAVPEGTPIFPDEPILTVRAPIIEAQLLETMLLATFNHQSLIATKANRIVRAAAGRPVTEFGARRAQGYDAANLGARAAYIGGCNGTSCTLTGEMFKVPLYGTMAHSWIQLFDSEYEAFKTFATLYPHNCLLLIDTFNALKQGLPNAIRVFDEVLKPLNIRPVGVRIDSGDITYLSIKVREMLDKAGYPDCKIMASNSLDENIIASILSEGAKIDMFGVGERLITSKSESVFGGVYKLAAIEQDGKIIPKIKISENVIKITNPHFKKVYRLFDNISGKAIADLVTLHSEKINEDMPLTIFDPDYSWKTKTITNFTAVSLLKRIFKNGKLVYENPSLEEIREYSKTEISKLYKELLRFENPHKYYVDLSKKLWDIKQKLLLKNKN
ncbi:MAG: nicotinate phosphoribosyltransferase [Clostridia bacterium]